MWNDNFKDVSEDLQELKELYNKQKDKEHNKCYRCDNAFILDSPSLYIDGNRYCLTCLDELILKLRNERLEKQPKIIKFIRKIFNDIKGRLIK